MAENVNMGTNNTIENNDEISLKELIQKIKDWVAYLKTKWKIIIIAGTLGASIGLVYAYRQPITFKAILTFVVEEDKNSTGAGLGILASQLGFDVGSSTSGGLFSGAKLLEFMQSRSIIEKTLLTPLVINKNNTNLAEYYIKIHKLRESWPENIKSKQTNYFFINDPSTFNKEQDSILETFYLNLTSPVNLKIGNEDKKSSLTSIIVESQDEIFSKFFCESLVNVTSQYYIELKSKRAQLNVKILQNQVDSIRNALNNDISSIAVNSDQNYNLNPTMSIRKTNNSKRALDVQSNTTIFVSLLSNLEMAKMSLRKETPLIQIIDPPTFPLRKNKVSKLKFLILGGFLAIISTSFYLVLLSLYKKIIA